VDAAARALIEELSMTTHTPDAPAPPSRGPGPDPEGAVVVLVPAMAKNDACDSMRPLGAGQRRWERRRRAPGLSVSLRPAAAIRQDACEVATLWLDSGERGTARDGEAQATAAERQAWAEQEAHDATVAAEVEAPQAAVAAQDTAAVEIQVADPRRPRLLTRPAWARWTGPVHKVPGPNRNRVASAGSSPRKPSEVPAAVGSAARTGTRAPPPPDDLPGGPGWVIRIRVDRLGGVGRWAAGYASRERS
jgi:hypothetical protein